MAGDRTGLLWGIDYPRALLLALTVVFAIAVVVAASTSGAAFGAYNPAWDGASTLRGEADAVGAEGQVVLNTTWYDDAPPKGTVALVLSPDRAYGPTATDRLRQFVDEGGTLVVAEDFGNHSNDLLAGVNATARFDGAILLDERHHHESPTLPVARNVSDHRLTRDVDRLTLNHGTVVEPGNASVLVRSSGYGYLDRNRNDQLDDDETLATHPVATVERVGDGRVVAVADPSLFINAMLDRPDNRAFVHALFRGTDRVLLDYSHAERLPPLAVALLVIRRTAVFQVLLGLGALAVVGAWGGGWFGRLRRRFGTDTPDDIGVDTEAMTAYLRRQHPDWDADRLRRVSEGVLRDRDEPGGDE